MMSVIKGWSSIRIPVHRSEQRNKTLVPQLSGDVGVEKSLSPGRTWEPLVPHNIMESEGQNGV